MKIKKDILKPYVIIFFAFTLTFVSIDKCTLASDEVYIREGLVSKIFDDSVALSSDESRDRFANWEIEPQAGMLKSEKLILSNDYFKTNYSNNFKYLTVFNISFSKYLNKSKFINLQMQTSIGHAYKRGNFSSQSSSGYIVEDTLTLRWIPILFQLQTSFYTPITSFVKPSLKGGIGGNWFSQTGSLDGINQSFWIPSYNLGGSLTFWGKNEFGEMRNSSLEGFGGLDISLLYLKSILSVQDFSGLIFQLGFKFNL